MALSIRDLFLSVMIFSAIVISFSVFIGDMADTYSFDVNRSLDSFDRINDTYNVVNDIRTPLDANSSVSEVSIGDMTVFAVDGAWQSLRLAFNIPGIIVGIISDASTFARIPQWVSDFAIAVITTLVIFLVISAIWKWRI